MEKKQRIRQLLPLIDQIKNEELRNAVVEIWVKAWEESQWEDIADCPWLLELEAQTCNLIQHTNFVATVAMAMASCAQDIWNTPVDTDLLLTGALLHDVSKPLEREPEEGKPGKPSAILENLGHSTYGVHLALNAGLPLKVVNIIRNHTRSVSMVPDFIEGMCVCHADHASGVFRLESGTPLTPERIK